MLAEAASVHDFNLREKPSEIGDDVRLRLTQGALTSASDYIKAQRARTEFNQQIKEALNKFDVLLSPTVPVGAPKINEQTITVGNLHQPTLSLLPRLTRPHNICGIPTISIPCGFTQQKTPIGIQIGGRAFDEKLVLRVAHAYESATDWGQSKPIL